MDDYRTLPEDWARDLQTELQGFLEQEYRLCQHEQPSRETTRSFWEQKLKEELGKQLDAHWAVQVPDQGELIREVLDARHHREMPSSAPAFATAIVEQVKRRAPIVHSL